MAIILRIRFSTEIKDLKLDITNTNVQVITPAWIRNIIRDTLKQRNENDNNYNVDVPIKLIRMGKVLRGKIYGKFIKEIEYTQKLENADKQLYLNAMMGSKEDFVSYEEEGKNDQLYKSGLEWFDHLPKNKNKKTNKKPHKPGISVANGSVMINIPGGLSSNQHENLDDSDNHDNDDHDENNDDEDIDMDDDDDGIEGQNVQVQGLDRLIDMGFSQQDINELREQLRQRIRYETGNTFISNDYPDETNNLTSHISQDGFVDLENDLLLNKKDYQGLNEEDDFQFTDDEILSSLRKENVMRSIVEQDALNDTIQDNSLSITRSRWDQSNNSQEHLNLNPHTPQLTEQERLLQLEEQFLQSVREDMSVDVTLIQKVTSFKMNLTLMLGFLLGISFGISNFFITFFLKDKLIPHELSINIIIVLMAGLFIGFNRS